MKETQTTFTPFKQIPEWSDSSEFTLTGAQLKAIQGLFEIYTPLVNAIEPLFVQGLNDGKITIRYEDLEGNELQKEEIDKMLKDYAELTAQSIQKETE